MPRHTYDGLHASGKDRFNKQINIYLQPYADISLKPLDPSVSRFLSASISNPFKHLSSKRGSSRHFDKPLQQEDNSDTHLSVNIVT